MRVRAQALGELERLAEELGIDVVGAAPAEPYEETERHIRERRERGLFADMRFTMARPEVSCHPGDAAPERAHGGLGRALLLRATSRSGSRARGGCRATPGSTRTPSCARSSTRSAARLGGEYRVLVDENDHVDREAAARVRRRLLRQEHDADHAPARVVGRARDARHRGRDRATPSRSTLDCGSCTLCIEACPTGALDEPGTLDSTRCLSYWTQAPGRSPRSTAPSSAPRSTAATSARTSARGTAGSRSAATDEPPPRRRRAARLARRVARALATTSCATRYERLYFPRKDPRYLRRNALVALGNAGDRGAPAGRSRRYAASDDPLLREHAEWALARLDEASE